MYIWMASLPSTVTCLQQFLLLNCLPVSWNPSRRVLLRDVLLLIGTSPLDIMGSAVAGESGCPVPVSTLGYLLCHPSPTLRQRGSVITQNRHVKAIIAFAATSSGSKLLPHVALLISKRRGVPCNSDRREILVNVEKTVTVFQLYCCDRLTDLMRLAVTSKHCRCYNDFYLPKAQFSLDLFPQ